MMQLKGTTTLVSPRMMHKKTRWNKTGASMKRDRPTPMAVKSEFKTAIKSHNKMTKNNHLMLQGRTKLGQNDRKMVNTPRATIARSWPRFSHLSFPRTRFTSTVKLQHQTTPICHLASMLKALQRIVPTISWNSGEREISFIVSPFPFMLECSLARFIESRLPQVAILLHDRERIMEIIIHGSNAQKKKPCKTQTNHNGFTIACIVAAII
mmetsp:Transcript_58388/g.190448  ORF Transcript_58388/g.190448 Transcript_58388/m.190448 type:complete len:210 (-) Transcript_58388:151-780(-)